MMRHKRVVLAALALPLFVSLVALAGDVKKPALPAVDQALEAKREAAFEKLKNLSVEEAFAELEHGELPADERFPGKAVSAAFEHRKKEAIALSIENIRQPALKMTDGKLVSRSDDFHLARKVLHAFPEESYNSILSLYGKTDPITKANMIRVLGGMPGDEKITNLLIAALDDKMFCEEEHPEMSGEPMRICDVAYSQLVLRCKVKGVLRTIGTGHKLELRNYHIDVLKDLLSKS
jgi:hypothetical protein